LTSLFYGCRKPKVSRALGVAILGPSLSPATLAALDAGVLSAVEFKLEKRKILSS
jgi:hypothetical protein